MNPRTVQSSDLTRNNPTQFGKAGSKLFAVFMSIVFVIGLMPALAVPQRAYADTHTVEIHQLPTSSSEYPLISSDHYASCATLYTAKEISSAGGSAGTITGIALYSLGRDISYTTDLDIYLGELSSSTTRLPYTYNESDYTHVYHAEDICPNEAYAGYWQTFDFNVANYEYKGDNLVVIISHSSENYSANIAFGSNTNLGDYYCMYKRSDTDETASNPFGSNLNYTVTNRADITLTFDDEAGTTPTPEPEPEPATYRITTNAGLNGSLAVSVKGEVATEATEDAEVSVTATPNSGYELDEITVVGDTSAKNITTTPAQDPNVCTFMMPAEPVTVAATWNAISTEPAAEVASVTIAGTTTTYTAENFDDAIAAANTGSKDYPATLTLLDNVDRASDPVEFSGNVTLDLNGYTLQGSAYEVCVVVDGKTTITDNSADQTGAITSTTCGVVSAMKGELVIDAGAIRAPGATYEDSALWTWAPLRIGTAYKYGGSNEAIAVTINGGVIESLTTGVDEYELADTAIEAYAFSQSQGVSLTVNGATIKGGAGYHENSPVVMIENATDATDDEASRETAPTFTVTGGTIEAATSSDTAIELARYTNTTIGSFDAADESNIRVYGTIDAIDSSAAFGIAPVIYAGRYTEDVSRYVPNGWECVADTSVAGYNYVVQPGSIKYSVATNASVNGSLSVSSRTAAEGDKISVTVSPNTGYQLAQGGLVIAYTDDETMTVEPEKVNDTTYTFIMPAADVTVSATFEEISYWEGAGSESDPYLISNVDDLKCLAQRVNVDGNGYVNRYFKVTDDITVEPEDEWIAIGYADSSTHFSGTFDGDSHVITINAPYTEDGAYNKLFSSTYNSAVYRNYIGLFGYLDTNTITAYAPTVKNVIVDGDIACYDTTYRTWAAGIAGYVANAAIINCENRANVHAWGCGNGDWAGGIAGTITGGYDDSDNVIINVYNSGDITASGSAGDAMGHAGGIAGTIESMHTLYPTAVQNAVISEGCVITQNDDVVVADEDEPLVRLAGTMTDDSVSNGWDRCVMEGGEVTQAELDMWNAEAEEFTDIDFWVLDELDLPIPHAASSVEFYTVSVISGEGGSVSANKTSCAAGARVSITVTADAGYELDTLMMTDGGGTPTPIEADESGNYAFLMPASDVIVTATFTKSSVSSEFTVTFDTQGGSFVASQSVEEGQCATRPGDDPVKDGFEFIGWYADEACTQVFDFDTPIEKDTTIYAGWVPAEYYITIINSQGGTITVSQSVADEGDKIEITVEPEDGYELEKLMMTDGGDLSTEIEPDADGNYTFLMPASDVIVTATWKKTEAPDPEPTPEPDPEPTPEPDPEPTPEPEENKIVVEENSGGSVSVDPEEAKAGDSVTVTVTPDEGFAIATFSIRDAFGNPVAYKDNGNGTYTFTMPDSEVTVDVTFAAITPEKITITKDMFEVDTSYAIYDGAAITKTIISNLKEGTDYTVAYANNNAPGEATITITGTGNYTGTLTYTFKIIHYFEDVGATKDDVNEWYFDAVYGMVDLGAITGYNETTFGVGDSMSRAQLVTIMWRYCEPDEYAAYDEPNAKDTTGLPDAQDGMYYTGAVNWAYANSVITGNQHEDGSYTLNPDDPVTFEQMVTILARYCLGSFDEAADYPQTALDNGNFTDRDVVEDWAAGSMSWAIANGVVTGNNNHNGTYTLSPRSDVARERAVTVLYRTISDGLLVADNK